MGQLLDLLNLSPDHLRALGGLPLAIANPSRWDDPQVAADLDEIAAGLPVTGREYVVSDLPVNSYVRHAGDSWVYVGLRGQLAELRTSFAPGAAVEWVEWDQRVSYEGDPIA